MAKATKPKKEEESKENVLLKMKQLESKTDLSIGTHIDVDDLLKEEPKSKTNFKAGEVVVDEYGQHYLIHEVDEVNELIYAAKTSHIHDSKWYHVINYKHWHKTK